MVCRIRRILAICVIVLLLVGLAFSFFFVANVAAVSLTISPITGHVGDRVTVSGQVPPEYYWNVSFDVNDDFIFQPPERLLYEKASNSSVLASSIIVPNCSGSDVGVVHIIQLATNFTPTSTPYGPYAPPYSVTANYTVYTEHTCRVPTEISVGDPITINISITGGMVNTTYNYRANVTEPDGVKFTTTFTALADSFGRATRQINYPADFSTGPSTNKVGTYTVTVQELSPFNIFSDSTNVVVSESTPTPTYGPPNASILSITPNSATTGENMTFSGYGNASSGYSIIRYRWISNISGEIGSTTNFTTKTLPAGVHYVTFEVQDSNNMWSTPASTTLTISSDSGTVTSTPTSTSTPTPSTPTPTPSTQPPPDDGTPTPTQTTPPPTSPVPTPSPTSNGSGSSGAQDDSPSPTPTNPPNGGDNTPPGNQPPTAHLTITPPTQITEGQSIILRGAATDPDGRIASYTWTSDISGTVSTNNQLDTANLSPGTHHITFQATDDDGAASNAVMIVLTVNSVSVSEPLPYLGAASAGVIAVAASVGAAGVWLHYSRLSSVKIKSNLTQKTAQQKIQEENQEKKDEQKNKKRANLVFSDFKIPQNIMKETGYTAQFDIRNVGTGKATNVLVHALDNPFFDFKVPLTSLADLSPGEKVTVTMPFSTNPEIRKNIYQQQFQVKSKQTPPKLKRCFMRGGRIAVLTDAEVPSVAAPVMNWLRENRYPFEEIHDAAHLMTQLYQYDLLIVSAKHDMPSKWVQNLCTFVENGQSLLLLDKISTRDPARLTAALGYVEEPNPITYTQAALEICQPHPITDGLSLGEHIQLGPCIANAAKFTQVTAPATVVANNINQQSDLNPSQPVAAVMVKQDGKGKIVHLNFHAQEHLNQIDRLIKNSVDWLLWD